MSTAFDDGRDDTDDPFSASHEEYIRTVEATEGSDLLSSSSEGSTSSYLGKGVEAPWSTLGETTEGDPFAKPDDDDSGANCG